MPLFLLPLIPIHAFISRLRYFFLLVVFDIISGRRVRVRSLQHVKPLDTVGDLLSSGEA